MNPRLIALGILVTALAACASTPMARGPSPTSPEEAPPAASSYAYPAAPCHACGHVVQIDLIPADRRTDGSGAVVGGVVGGVLGDSASTATAAGNAAQKSASTSPSYDIRVQMDDGRKLILNQHELGGIAVGSTVDVYDNRAHLVR